MRHFKDASYTDFWRKNPSWFNNIVLTRAQRTKTRVMLDSLLRLEDLENAPIFPHPKKPYWWFI